MKKLLSVFLALIIALGTFSVCSAESFALSDADVLEGMKFVSLTDEQIKTLNNGGKIGSAVKSQLPKNINSSKLPNLPKSFSLQEYGLDTPVADQGQMGTCWAFSALASSESFFTQRDSFYNFSERHLAWFSYTSEDQQDAFRYIFDDIDPYMIGGFDLTAGNSLANWFGPVYESDYAYSNEPIDEGARRESVAHLQNIISFPEIDTYSEVDSENARKWIVSQVKSEMYKTRQGVDISYFASYEDENYNPETYAWFNPDENGTNHAVTIVGWNDNFPKENFYNSEFLTSNGAWLVKNSWGTGWGDDGYFWLSYEDKTIDYDAIYLYESKFNHEKIYSHDESVQYSPVGFDGSTDLYMANIFTSEENENLEAVSFYTTDVNTEYAVDIYKNISDPKDPTSGEKVSSFNGIKKLPGYYTEKLPEKVLLNADEKFSVVVYVSNPTSELPAQVEAIYMKYRIQSDDDVSNAGESFVSHKGDLWVDIHQKIIKDPDDPSDWMRLGNFAIKAFTSSDKYVKFSIEGGDVSFKETLELTSSGADEIYYTLDGTDPVLNGILYTSPIILSDGMTVTAVGKKDGEYGVALSQVYNQAKASLNSLEITDAEKTFNLRLDNSYIGTFFASNTSEKLNVKAESYQDVYINSQKVELGEEFTLNLREFEKNTITIEVNGEGYLPRTYTVEFYVNPISYDFDNETILFDEDNVKVITRQGEDVKSGQSVSAWLDSDTKTEFIIEFGEEYCIDVLPERIKVPKIEIDYIFESSLDILNGIFYYKTDPESDFEMYIEDDYLPLFPGETMYVYAPAQKGLFKSNVVEWEIPARPTVEDVELINVKKTKIELSYIEGLEYYCYEERKFFSGGVLAELIPGKVYTVEVYMPATEEAFGATAFFGEITTLNDSTLDKLQSTVDKAENDPTFFNKIGAFFAQIIYSIRLFFVTVFD